VQQGWPDVLARLAADSRVAWTAFHAAVPVSLSGGALAVAVSEPGNVRAIAQRGHDERLRQALIDVLGLDVSIDVLHDPAAASPVARPPAGREPRARPPAAPRGTPGSASGSSAGPPPGHTAQSDAAAGAGAARRSGRAGDVVRDAATAPGEPTERVDEPSTDDPDLDASAGDGLALVTRELGARPIGEIDHS
jgi:DNA polymerase-3 subunit gamma/tau